MSYKPIKNLTVEEYQTFHLKKLTFGEWSKILVDCIMVDFVGEDVHDGIVTEEVEDETLKQLNEADDMFETLKVFRNYVCKYHLLKEE